MVCLRCSFPLPDFLDYTRATQRVAGVCRLVLHSLIHFSRPEDLFVIGKSHAHAVANRVLIFALKLRTSAKKDSMRSSIGFTGLPLANDNSKLPYFAVVGWSRPNGGPA